VVALSLEDSKDQVMEFMHSLETTIIKYALLNVEEL
jgi:hypothetical protein